MTGQARDDEERRRYVTFRLAVRVEHLDVERREYILVYDHPIASRLLVARVYRLRLPVGPVEALLELRQRERVREHADDNLKSNQIHLYTAYLKPITTKTINVKIKLNYNHSHH